MKAVIDEPGKVLEGRSPFMVAATEDGEPDPAEIRGFLANPLCEVDGVIRWRSIVGSGRHQHGTCRGQKIDRLVERGDADLEAPLASRLGEVQRDILGGAEVRPEQDK